MDAKLIQMQFNNGPCLCFCFAFKSEYLFVHLAHKLILPIRSISGDTSPAAQYASVMSANAQAQYTTGSFSPQAEPVDFSGLTRPLGIEYVSSLGSSSYSRDSTPSNGSSVHFMDGYRDFNGKWR